MGGRQKEQKAILVKMASEKWNINVKTIVGKSIALTASGHHKIQDLKVCLDIGYSHKQIESVHACKIWFDFQRLLCSF